ncbi:fumarylacetoacetate hydrolase family protein [Microbacterium testaceum]|uniref:fumarylacetoacetate hydrolase family protein n=1 Tax=Microbacterium testaceum TaxID=2033 RepID=UPI001245362F|nr:fumarylacetoacetate hydrolase family protein [Microbacterium testaceum]
MLTKNQVEALAAELVEADRKRGTVRRITARYPNATVEDSYAIQTTWSEWKAAAGHKIVGHKIGLASATTEDMTGITDPNHGVIFDDTIFDSRIQIDSERRSDVRVQVELALVLSTPLQGPDRTVDDVLAAIGYAVPALGILNSSMEVRGRTSVDTIGANADYGATVIGTTRMRPDEIDLDWIPGVLWKNGKVVETGVSAGVVASAVRRVAWLANKLDQHGSRLEAGDLILAGSFTRPVWVNGGDDLLCDFGPMGEVRCRFV